MKDLRIYAADVGSIKRGNFGWIRSPSTGLSDNDHSNIKILCDFLIDDLSNGLPVALGFEAPLFIPISENHRELGSCRCVDIKNRAWSAGGGACVLATGAAQLPWILKTLSRKSSICFPCFLIWEEFKEAGKGLFIWEAFVTGDAKGKSHIEDASIALKAFQASLPNPTHNPPAEQGQIFNLAGSALLWSGLSTDRELLHQPCLVIKA